MGFDLLPDYGSDVQYVKAPERLKFPLDEDWAGRAPYLKYDGWSYEREVRIGVLLKEPAPNGFHYNSFGDGFILKEVIVGSANPISNTSMQKLLRPHLGVSMRKVRPAYKEFMMVKDLRGLS